MRRRNQGEQQHEKERQREEGVNPCNCQCANPKHEPTERKEKNIKRRGGRER